MILYFSATGNCKYAALRLAQALDDEAVSILDLTDANAAAIEDETVGIVSPTYNFGLPSIMREFLENARIRAGYLFFVATYGTTPAGTGHFAQKYLDARIDAFFSVRMPDTWTPVFDLSTPDKVARFETTTESDIDLAIEKARARATGNYMKRRVPAFVAEPAYALSYDTVRLTDHLHVEDECIGCGLCAKRCPVQAIEMRDKLPTWTKERCAMCLGCLHRCPRFAIHYDNRTQRHGQYTNPHVKA